MEHRSFTINGVDLHAVEQGSGPLVLLCHGWPECWYSWRHLVPALAAAGYRALAPDLRGFGRSDAPEREDAYSIMHLVGDIVGLVQAAGETRAVIIGHDWGANIAWNAALLRPDMFRAVVAMSVPFRVRPPAPPLQMLRQAGMTDFYWLYFQTPGVAEAEFERDVPTTLRRILYSGSGDARGAGLSLNVPKGGGFLDLTIDPPELPPWLSEADLAFVAGEYRRTGFRGGLSLYRNFDRNWELLAPWHGAQVRQPALFVAGSLDAVINSALGKAPLEAMPKHVPELRGTLLLEGAGHWIQQERPAEVNAAVLEFLRGLPG